MPVCSVQTGFRGEIAPRGSPNRARAGLFVRTDLIAPDVRLHQSWLDAMDEFKGAHLDGAGVEGDCLDRLRDPVDSARFV